MPIKDRKRVRLNRRGVIRLGYRVFHCNDGHAKAPTRWNGSASQDCSVCGKMRSGLSERSGVSPYQPGHFVLKDAPEIQAFYESRGVPETEVRELEVLFPFAERDKNFIANYQVWTASTVVCEGDGEYVGRASPFELSESKSGYLRIRQSAGDTLVNNGMACRPFDWNGTHFEPGDHVPCSGKDKDLYPHCALCKLNSLFKVMMAEPELFDIGYYQVATGSANNYDAFDTMFDIMPANVQGIRFRLLMEKGPTQYRGKDGKMHKTEKWFLFLKPRRADLLQMFEQNAASQIGQGTVVAAPQLEAESVIIEEPEYIDDEQPPDENEPPEPESPPLDVQTRPDFSNWKAGKWTTFCALAVERLGCFTETSAVWALLTSMHENPPNVGYDVAWTTCEEHNQAGGK